MTPQFYRSLSVHNYHHDVHARAAGTIENYQKIFYLLFQSEKICFIAIHEHYSALIYIRNQTIEMCRAAMQKDECAICYITDSDLADAIILSYDEHTRAKLRKWRGNYKR